ATRTKVNEGVTAFVIDPAQQARKPMTKLEKLDKVVADMKSSSTLAVLDEIYVRAEGNLEDAELEVALREYRKCKDSINEKGSLI
ncbi:MAG: Recombination and repair protein Rac prophage (Modular protein), partial [Candidatus Gallionella acididurans]